MKKLPSYRIIAFFLPQFHPIPENDKWWGKGFTEWTNVGKAKKLHPFHYQPKLPGDLGYYDLRLDEVKIAQTELAKKYGIDGFCYWHYWFGNGETLLDQPVKQLLRNKKIDQKFCFAWANESWKGFPHGLKNRNTLIEQKYPGAHDEEEHFQYVLPFFKDERYLKINEEVIFLVYKPLEHPNIKSFISRWRKLAHDNGLEGIHFIAQTTQDKELEKLLSLGFDSVNVIRLFEFLKYQTIIEKLFKKILQLIFGLPRIHNYERSTKFMYNRNDSNDQIVPTIIPNWDHTPRSGKDGLVLRNCNPKSFRKNLFHFKKFTKNKNNNLVFLKSWNEWAEGNYVEPDQKYGLKYLEIIKDELK